MNRPHRELARTALDGAAVCALIVALILLLAPISFNHGYYAALWVVPFALVRLSLPLGFVWILRLYLSAPGDGPSHAVRISAWTGIVVSAAGMMWMSESIRRDIHWLFLLVMSESARLAVMHRSMGTRVVAIGALGAALGASRALGSDVMTISPLGPWPVSAFASVHVFVATHPWVAMLGLAGLWAWAALADRHAVVPVAATVVPRAQGARGGGQGDLPPRTKRDMRLTAQKGLRTLARATMNVPACARVIALVLLIPPIFFDRYSIVWRLIVLVFETFYLVVPLGLVGILRWYLSAPGDVLSGAVRSCAWTGIFVSLAGHMWMSGSDQFFLGFVGFGWGDLPWVCLLVASEAARLAVIRRSWRPRVVAIGALALALGSWLTLGSRAMKVNHLDSLPMSAFGSIHAFVATHPWVAMLGLAWLWVWVGRADKPIQERAVGGQ